LDGLGDRFVIFSHIPHATSGKLLYLSNGFEKIFGIPKSALLDRPWYTVIDWLEEDIPKGIESNQRLLAGEISSSFEMRFRHVDGDIRTLYVTEYAETDESGQLLIEGICEDITERKKTEELRNNYRNRLEKAIKSRTRQLEKLIQAVNQSPSMLVITDQQGHIEYVNNAFSHVSGYQAYQVIGKSIKTLSLDNSKEFEAMMNHLQINKSLWRGEIWSEKQSKEKYLVSLTASPLRDEHGEISHYLFNAEDITEKKADKATIHRLSNFDDLTGLYNRSSLQNRLAELILKADSHKHQFAVFLLDLDRFKSINDTMGHEAGDTLLYQLASRLKNNHLFKADCLARIGGDEFVVVKSDLKNISDISLMAEQLMEVLQPAYELDKPTIITPSIGIAIYPQDGNSVEELLINADTAMYHIKDQGRSNYGFYTSRLNDIVRENNLIVEELRKATNDGSLELYYQPKIDLKNNRHFAVEALIRWNHDELGIVSRDKVITIAEERGLIYPIGLWVIESAFQQLLDWRKQSDHIIRIAINLSAKQLDNLNLIADIERLVDHYKIDASLIEFEITESTAMQNPELCIRCLDCLSEMGFLLTVDDFGTGYSSLSYLKMLPIQALKLDKSFIENLLTDDVSSTISKATISLGHEMDLTVVAEGVETKAQLDFLTEHNCDVIQGYYFSRPLTADAVVDFFESRLS